MIEVNDMYFVDEKTAWVNWNYKDDARKCDVVSSTQNLSLVTGAYTTAQARLLLYEQLHRLQHRMLYCDTDSIIYIENVDVHNEYKPSIGMNIGDLTDEITSIGPDAYISEFCSVGPKSYSIRIKLSKNCDAEEKEISKLKGFICTSASKKNLSFDNYKKMVFGCCNKAGAIDKHTIVSKTKNINRRNFFNVVTIEQQKSFGFTYDKRIVTDAFGTIPYGYEEN